MSSQRVGVSRRRTRRQVIVWTSVAVVISVCAAVLPYLEIRGVAAIPVAQALVPLGALVLLLLAITSLIFRVWAAALVLIVGAVISGVPALTPVHVGEACESDARVTVLSFNAKLAGADPAAIAALIRTTEPDAVMLLEADETLIDAVLTEDGLADVLPYRTHEVTPGPANGSVILSAHPLSLEENIPGSEFDQVSAVATLPGAGTVRLAAVHPPPPVWQPNGWRSGIDDITTWVRQTRDDRLIIAGDFNASFAHPVLRGLASGLRSAAEAAGPIPWPTWPEEKPIPAFTAIDHIFARGATPTHWDSFHVEGSDHRAVIATWNLCATAKPVT
ncbi:MAG: endonuclease/exonuclease/phosphatase family protein [Microbacterium sp.]|uniref:endonuclease/exonuclease/phosphatase family protein n=1 Tax=Microbacterium esteraromaticum TaxID=57043 RepID=UPI0015C652CF|nr:endonuclease/exonuclease/phosphatase family protein [Microbacterium esteraromaticum]MDN5746294.1 endonuclease/exonuclease/phosphatase family protein [Nocardioidaceae bacterium]